MTKKEINAITFVEQVVNMAAVISESAQAYQSAFATSPRVKVAVGKIFQTIDGSLVSVLKPVDTTVCATCGKQAAQHSPIVQMFGMLTGQTPEQVAEMAQADAESDDGDDNDDQAEGCSGMESAGEQFLCVVVQGGHGIENYPGNEPGSKYVVDKTGLVVLLDNLDSGVIVKSHLALIGLSLKRAMRTTFTPEE